MPDAESPLTVFIASPLEPEHVEQIRAVDPIRITVLYEPDLLPPTRYIADHKGREDFRRTPEQEGRWLGALRRADILWDFPAARPGASDIRDLAPKLKWIQATSAGVGQRVKALQLHDSDVVVTTASGVHAGPLTEFVVMAMLIHVKNYHRSREQQAAYRWMRYCGDELEAKTLAIVGAGRVGRQVAAAGRFFGMRVVAMVAKIRPDQATSFGLDAVYPREDLSAMLSEADVLVLSVPHTPETENMIDARAFQALKPGAVFINIARGQVVDESALIESLRAGRIAFAALDVAAVEPLPSDSPLWDMPNVLISPHSASTARSENRKITDIFCHNLRCYLDGRTAEMRNVLDKVKMY
jgi:phosphoglycerate dehydrogenase-like enzyme